MIARHDTHGFAAAHIDTNIAAHRIHHINSLGLAQLPRARRKGIGPRSQRADRAQINNIARQLAIQRGFQISCDFRVLAAPNRADFRNTRHFLRKADTTRAMDAARHHGFHQRAHILVFNSALIIVKTTGIAAKAQCLVLQVAFAALVANRAIQRVINEQKLHHPFARRFDCIGCGGNHHIGGHRHGTAGYGLGCIGHFDQTHAAITGHRQALVIAKARNFRTGLFASLQNRRARRNLNSHAINSEFDLIVLCISHYWAASRAAAPSASRSSINGRK